VNITAQLATHEDLIANPVIITFPSVGNEADPIQLFGRGRGKLSMIERGFRVAIWVVMALLVIVAGRAETVVSATDCEIPTSLEVGKTYWFAVGMAVSLGWWRSIGRPAGSKQKSVRARCSG